MARSRNASDETIIEAYRELRAGRKVAAALRVAEVTVYKVLREHGVARTGLSEFRQRIRKFNPDDVRDLVREYSAGASAARLAASRGCSTETVLNALKAAGILIRGSKPRMRAAEKLEAKALYETGLTFAEVAAKTGRHENTILKLLNSEHPKSVRSGSVGPGSPHWRTGRVKDGHGYIWVWLSANDPMAGMASMRRDSRIRYVLEHRLVMARNLGRPLRPTETVHHINGDKADNRLENLELRQGKHGKHVVMVCLDCGSHNIGHAPTGR